ncbi:glycosyltransferase [Alkalisalibacterium limincola]|uniref:glycosyltransferase n=1 Tax=Alkalisalibacterium limincola TaxID=2699169 RepID=UPI00164F6303|nr:glycosyltransferase [Alkalisalibacterium limincola]
MSSCAYAKARNDCIDRIQRDRVIADGHRRQYCGELSILRIVQVNSVYNTGSTGRIVEGIAMAARLRGHRTWVAYGRPSNPGPTEAYRISGPLDHAMHGLYSLALDGHGLGSATSTQRMIHWLDSLNPDLVCLHNVHGYYLNIPILFDWLRRTRTAVVWTLHDCWPLTGHCANFDRFGCEKWRNGCGGCPMTSFYPRSLTDRSAQNWVWKRDLFTQLDNVTIITPSRWLQSIARQSFLGSFRIDCIPNGIDLDVFVPRANDPRPNDDNRPVVLGVANHWSDAKGLADFSALRKLLPDFYRVVLVGVEAKHRSRLAEGVEGLPRTQDIHALAKLYADARVFVNPTYSDNFPTTNLEALASGTPVVTYDTGGSPESLEPHVGKVVEKGNVRAMAEAIIDVCAMNREKMRQDCRVHAVKHFNRDERFFDYAILFEQLLSEGGSSH